MRQLIACLVTRLDTFLRRCWLTWRFMRVMGDSFPMAWYKAGRSS